MALPGVYNLSDLYKGDTFGGVTFTLELDGGGYVDLTGVSIRCQFRRGKETGTVVKEISVGSGITIVDVNGVFSIDSFDVTFGAGFYVYDIEVTSGSDIRTYVKGSLTVKQDVTYG